MAWLVFVLGCSGSGAEPAGNEDSTTGGSTGGNAPTSAGGDAASGGSPAGAGGSLGSGGDARGDGGSDASGGSSPSGGSGACVPHLDCQLDPPPSSGDIYQDCVDRINQFLTECACLPALTRRTDGEACADQMAEYDALSDTPHAGANDQICQPGGAQNECPGYSSNEQVIGLCLQQMWDEGPPPSEPCTGSCFQEYGHFINMTDPSVTQVACGFYTTESGKVWSVQNFTR